ncbi:hypothetical protein KP509_11G004100 [Ceratopteris richardii]|uniref:Uncharacterized protein n=1 Tax=Ceratopteris richardii TaxID=49495 RepID=A0A8T2TRH3_CERRI|nr:hypothetical protein KP509_11G004100 [Ceratopteris richardii]
MACRALGRNIHRASCSLSSLRSLIAHSPIGDVPLSSSQAVQSSSSLSSLSHTGMLKGVSSSPSETLFLYSFVGQRHFSSTPYSSDSEGRPNDGVSICSSNAEDPTSPVAEGLVADSSLDIPSPAGFTIACLDALNNVTGLPWWATLSLSAVILRALLVPVKSIQIQKVAELHKIGPKLQLQRLFMGNFMEEYRQLRKRKRELSAPSFLWIHGPVIFLQVPLVVTVLYSIRKMALLNHVGFDMGGFLWKDLTVPGQGLAGAVLPFTIAAAYLANLHVLFRDYRDVDGFLGKVEKSFRKFLKYCTILVFGFSYNAPQAIHVFLAPHFLMTLLQVCHSTYSFLSLSCLKSGII